MKTPAMTECLRPTAWSVCQLRRTKYRHEITSSVSSTAFASHIGQEGSAIEIRGLRTRESIAEPLLAYVVAVCFPASRGNEPTNPCLPCFRSVIQVLGILVPATMMVGRLCYLTYYRAQRGTYRESLERLALAVAHPE